MNQIRTVEFVSGIQTIICAPYENRTVLGRCKIVLMTEVMNPFPFKSFWTVDDSCCTRVILKVWRESSPVAAVNIINSMFVKIATYHLMASNSFDPICCQFNLLNCSMCSSSFLQEFSNLKIVENPLLIILDFGFRMAYYELKNVLHKNTKLYDRCPSHQSSFAKKWLEVRSSACNFTRVLLCWYKNRCMWRDLFDSTPYPLFVSSRTKCHLCKWDCWISKTEDVMYV